MKMKVSVDKELCTGCELCVTSCPDVFEMDGDVAKAKNRFSDNKKLESGLYFGYF
jgi:ferredoxin